MRVFPFCLFIISSFSVFSQTIETDSIVSIINSCQPFEGDSCQTIVQEVIESVKNNSNPQFYPEVLFYVGKTFYDNGDLEKGEQLLIQAKSISDSLGTTDLIANSNKLLGVISLGKGDLKQSLIYSLRAAKVWEESGNKFGLAKVYHNISTVYFNMNMLNKSRYYDNLQKGIAEDLGDDQLRLEAMSSTALNSMTYGVHYYLQNKQDTLNIQNTQDTLNFYFKKSDDQHQEALILARKIGSEMDELSILNNLVALTLNMENNEKALKLAKESEILAESVGDVDQLIQSKVNIGSAYRRLGKLDLATRYGEKSLALSKKNGLERKEYIANRTLYELYKTMGKYSKANPILEELRSYDLRTGDIERSKAIAEIDAQYQLVKKENDIMELEIENAKIEAQRNSIFGGALLMSLFSFLVFRFMKIRRERNDKKEFAEALITAQEEERKRIARDLHDGVGQALLLMKKQMVSTHEITVENQKMISDTLEEVRTISRDLHPFQLEKFGITTSINDVIEKVERSTDLFISKEIINIDESVVRENQIHIYRAIQEAFSNIVKHAEATAAKVSIVEKGNELIMKIMDNGKGFDHELAIIKSRSLGLRTINERISYIGGRFKIEQNAPSGTILTFMIPKNI
ncbi:sensor histidine kinase [Saprospiraceae bacterium]|nr:sensor histidine kinase [Saprospiraceae bacterium]